MLEINNIKKGHIVTFLDSEYREMVGVYQGETENSYQFSRLFNIVIAPDSEGQNRLATQEITTNTMNKNINVPFVISKSDVYQIGRTSDEMSEKIKLQYNILEVF